MEILYLCRKGKIISDELKTLREGWQIIGKKGQSDAQPSVKYFLHARIWLRRDFCYMIFKTEMNSWQSDTNFP